MYLLRPVDSFRTWTQSYFKPEVVVIYVSTNKDLACIYMELAILCLDLQGMLV